MNLDDTKDRLISAYSIAKEVFVEALPNIVTAALVLLLGWVLARFLRSVALRLFGALRTRIKTDATRAAWTESVDEQGSASIAAGGLYWLVLLTSILIAVDALDLPGFSRWIGAIAGYLPRFFIAGALLFGGALAGRLAKNAILQTAGRLSPAQARGVGRFVQISIIAATSLIAAGQVGLDVSLLTTMFLIVLATALGGAALAFGLGAQGIMSDILSMHYVHRSYRVGQWVRIGEHRGRIIRTTRTSVLLDSDDGELVVPGRKFAESLCVVLEEEARHES